MGYKKSWLWISMVLCFFIYSSFVESSYNNFTRDSLDSLIRDYAFEGMLKSHTGYLYNVSIPGNLSGIEASVIRLRSGSLWTRGANYSYFDLPPRIIPIPFVKRVTIVYQNLGNWSNSDLYHMEGYSLVSPVVGFMAYESSSSKLELNVTEHVISIRFPKILIHDHQGLNNSTLKCVRYGKDGLKELSEVRLGNICVTKVQGHFSIVMRSVERKKEDYKDKKKKEKLWKCLIIGFVFGFIGLVVIGLIGFVIFRYVKMKKIGEMEKQADDGEAFETFWIGNSKMPSAKIMRTQPALEYRETL